jgi:hypothetical protein
MELERLEMELERLGEELRGDGSPLPRVATTFGGILVS